MNLQQLKYLNSLPEERRKNYLLQRTKLELAYFTKLMDDSDAKPSSLERFDKLTNYSKELEFDIILEELGKLYNLDGKLYFKQQDIEKQRKDLANIIKELEQELCSCNR